LEREGLMKLGRYTLVGKLGAGAMSEVHAARLDGPGGFSRRVAIKRIRPHRRMIGRGRA
jgi:serine/threonine-protein kinase